MKINIEIGPNWFTKKLGVVVQSVKDRKTNKKAKKLVAHYAQEANRLEG